MSTWPPKHLDTGFWRVRLPGHRMLSVLWVLVVFATWTLWTCELWCVFVLSVPIVLLCGLSVWFLIHVPCVLDPLPPALSALWSLLCVVSDGAFTDASLYVAGRCLTIVLRFMTKATSYSMIFRISSNPSSPSTKYDAGR